MNEIMGDAMTELMTNCIKRSGGVFLPIKKIDNIPVSINIWYSSNRNAEYILFHYAIYSTTCRWEFIHSEAIGRIKPDDDEEIILQVQKKTFLDMLKKIKTMCINFYSGKMEFGLCNNTKVHPNLHKEFREFFREDSTDTFFEISDDCCVCYTATTTYTNCKHCICWECLAKIIPDEHTKPKCPLCRQRIDKIVNTRLIAKDEDEDEDEEEDEDED